MSHKYELQLNLRNNISPISYSAGGVLPIAIFIIVVMSLLGITMQRLLFDASRSTVADVYGARADLAARSGAEIILTEIFPLGESVNDNVCVNRGEDLVPVSFSFSAPGLIGCSAAVACDQLELQAPYQGINFRIRSAGTCLIGGNQYSKELVLEASHEVF